MVLVRPARIADIPAIVTLWDEANAWIASRGIIPELPPRELGLILLERIPRGGVYVASRALEIFGTITVDRDGHDVWDDTEGEAGYIHGFTVNRVSAGLGLELLRFAEARVAKDMGLKLARLDCSAFNPDLCDYYEHAGYRHRGNIALSDRTASRYEKLLSGECDAPDTV